MRHRMFTRVVMLASMAAASHTTLADTATGITWTTCPNQLTDLAPTLAARMQCGRMTAPLDQRQPDGATTTIALIRVQASRTSQREGSLFFNFGGPGVHPALHLLSWAESWSNQDPDHRQHGDKRLLADRYDLVAVVPRGVAWNTPLTCEPFDTEAARGYFLGGRDDAAWDRLVAAASSFATACSAKTGAAQVDTGQHVRDMELARQYLGEAKLNFYGASYGGWVGASYGALFPHNVGRMVLDSTVDARRGWHQQRNGRMFQRERVLWTKGLLPTAGRPAVWGLGDSASAIRQRLFDMPLALRSLWGEQVTFPENVVAALQVSDWYRSASDNERSRTALSQRASAHRFHANDEIDQVIRESALSLVAALPEDPRGWPPVKYEVSAATLAVLCNDTPWPESVEALKNVSRFNAENFTFNAGHDTLLALICMHWRRGNATAPSLAALGTAPPFLMIHGGVDWSTPLAGAQAMADALPNTSLTVVSNVISHAILDSPYAACAAEDAGRFLLTGQLPASRRTTCETGYPQTAVPAAVELHHDEL